MNFKNNPRYIAAIRLNEILNGQSLNALAKRDDADDKYIQFLLYGALRNFEYLNDILNQKVAKPIKKSEQLVFSVFILALYEVIFMQTAEYAAVNNWVQLIKDLDKKWASGLLNGVLRGVIREKPLKAKTKEGQYNLPKWLLNRIEKNWPHLLPEIADFYQHQPAMTLNIYTDSENILAAFNEKNIDWQKHAFVDSAVVLGKSMPVTEIPGFLEGKVSVQDASAQLVASHILTIEENARVLDACAAPGGKTIALLNSQNKVKEIVALDISAERLSLVSQNLMRYYDENSRNKVTLKASDFMDYEDNETFDAILLDAPCSATGIIHRQPDIKRHRTEADIKMLAYTQKKMLDKAWNLLKEGGKLLYATCSILPEENSLQMKSFLERHSDASVCNIAFKGENYSDIGLQILPVMAEESQKMDGFYYCLLQKNH